MLGLATTAVTTRRAAEPSDVKHPPQLTRADDTDSETGLAPAHELRHPLAVRARDWISGHFCEIHAPLGLHACGFYNHVYDQPRVPVRSEPADALYLQRDGGRTARHAGRHTSSKRAADTTASALPRSVAELLMRLSRDPVDQQDAAWAGAPALLPAVVDRLGAGDDPELADGMRLLVTQALLTGRVPASLTSLVLDRLRVPGWWRHVGAGPACPPDAVDRLALALAQRLSRSGLGLRALRALGGDAAVTATAARVRLQAGDYLRAHPVQTVDATHPARLAWEAAGVCLAGGKPTSAQRLALFEWSHGVPHDDGATLRRMQAVLHKFQHKTIHRWGVEDSLRLGLMRLVGKRQGPLRAAMLCDPAPLRKTGTAPATGGGLASVAAAADARREALEAALRTPEMSILAVARQADPVNALLETAAWRCWCRQGGPDPWELSERLAEEVSEEASRMCLRQLDSLQEPWPDPTTMRRLNVIGDTWLAMTALSLLATGGYAAVLAQPRTWKHLLAWSRDAGQGVSPAMRLVVRTLRRCGTSTIAVAAPLAAPQEPAAQTDTMRQLARDMVRGLATISRLQLSDGQVQGASTKQLSRIASAAATLSGVPVSAEVDLAATQFRESVFELARGPDGIRLFIGTATGSSQQVKLEAGVGCRVSVPGVAARADLRLSATPLHRELIRPEGLLIRIARRPTADGADFDDEAMYRSAEAVVDHLFTSAPSASEDAAIDTWRRLVDYALYRDDLSVNWVNALSVESSGSAQGSAGVTARVMNLSVGPEVFAQAHLHYGSRHDWHETGRRRVLEYQHRVGHGFQVGAALGLRMSVGGRNTSTQDEPEVTPMPAHPAPVELTGDPATATSSTPNRIKLTVADLHLPVHTRHFNHLRSGKLRLVEEGGDIVAHASTFDVEYQDRADWEDALCAELFGWLATFEAQATLQGRSRPADAASAKLGRFLRLVQRNERDFDAYLLRYQLRDSVARRVNLNRALLAGLGDDAPPVLRRQVEAENAAMLHERGAWIEVELKVRQHAVSFRRSGLDFGVKLQRRLRLYSERDWIGLRATPAAVRARESDDTRPIAQPNYWPAKVG
ncbi:hypothetical protein [Xylophilus sp. GOD-11R]|uniref:hypothetical protein n=1 Tax=Xylophilus sp. GOD-11R TaxID=3089814 RepID=UPI00298D42EF|nr:hypothetical protein [Xylophilus sp. GOD-11R]WPB56986.1 hypothetical protein R9X41_23110 [Xylophilus sp. GOD-11R]